MSQANEELLRRLYNAYNEGEVETGLSLLHPDAELHQAAEIPDTDSYYGRDDFVRGLLRWTREWETFRFEPVGFDPAGDGKVLVRLVLTGTARHTGLEVSEDVFHLWTVDEGKARSCRVFFNGDSARRAAGLPG